MENGKTLKVIDSNSSAKNPLIVAVTVLSLLCIFPQVSYSKTVRLQGHVKCMDEGDRAPSPAKYILVIPKKYLKKSVLTNEIGFYHIFLPGRIIDNNLTLHYRNSKKDLYKKSINIFETEINKIEDAYIYFVEAVELDIPCSEAEDDENIMYEQLLFFRKKPEEASSLLATTGATAIILPALIVAGGAGAALEEKEEPKLLGIKVIDLSKKTIKNGKILSYSLNAFSDNMGFNFAPKRNISEAVYWNPSAIAMSYFSQVSAYSDSDFKHYYQLSGVFNIKDTFGLGFGYLHLTQEDKITGLLETGQTVSETFETNEDGIFLSSSILFKNVLHDFFSIGITGKLLRQTIELPGSIVFLAETTGEFVSWESKKEKRIIYDFDVSATYRLNSSTTLGVNLMNIAGKKLINENGFEITQRAIRLGGSYQWKRLQLGSDIIYREDDSADIALGINIVPFNSALIHTGYDTTSDCVKTQNFEIEP